MSQPEESVAEASAQGSRTLVVSFLGAVVHRLDNWMPIGGTVDLMTQAGLDAGSVRTAVFRLKRRTWLASESRHGVRGYALTATSLAALEAGDRIIWHAREPANLAAGWCVVSFSIPESDRTKRHQLRSSLSELGFGNVGSGMWIAPARVHGEAQRAIDGLGLLPRCAIFVGDHAGGEDLRTLVAHGWDIQGIDERYRRFVEDYTPLMDRLTVAAAHGQEAFVAYLRVVDHWRKLPYRDPGLPGEVLPANWSAPVAAALFERLMDTLQGPALAHAGRRWPTPHVPPTPSVPTGGQVVER